MARRAHSMGGGVPRRVRIEAAAAAAKNSEASETDDEVPRGFSKETTIAKKSTAAEDVAKRRP